jgi:hypothetical protein
MLVLKRLKKNDLFIWIVAVPLAICLVFSLFYLIKDSALSRPLEDAIWGVSIFILLARIGYNLELNTVKGYYRSYLGISLLVTICGLAIAVVSTILGLIGFVALVPISILILIFCLIFSSDFFNIDRLPFCLRLLVSVLIVGLVVTAIVFLF